MSTELVTNTIKLKIYRAEFRSQNRYTDLGVLAPNNGNNNQYDLYCVEGTEKEGYEYKIYRDFDFKNSPTYIPGSFEIIFTVTYDQTELENRIGSVPAPKAYQTDDIYKDCYDNSRSWYRRVIDVLR